MYNAIIVFVPLQLLITELLRRFLLNVVLKV
jgi:hypothetical protein